MPKLILPKRPYSLSGSLHSGPNVSHKRRIHLGPARVFFMALGLLTLLAGAAFALVALGVRL